MYRPFCATPIPQCEVDVNMAPPHTAESDHSMPASIEKETAVSNSPEHLEVIRTVSRVPGNTHYYEKDGLRTYGDEEDHDHEPPMTINRLMSLIAMAFLWTGSQIPVYLFGRYRKPKRCRLSC